MAKAIAFATAEHRQPSPAGPQRPGQRPPRPRRALLARRVGRWPTSVSSSAVTGGHRRARAGETYTFPFPARPGRRRFPGGKRVKARAGSVCGLRAQSGFFASRRSSLQPVIWRRPSPSPRDSFGEETGRDAKAFRPAPAPPSAGASRPPGRALAYRGSFRHRYRRQSSRTGGGNACVSFSRPARWWGTWSPPGVASRRPGARGGAGWSLPVPARVAGQSPAQRRVHAR